MQQENMRPQINIDINDKQNDEIYQKNKIDDKESEEKNQISKIDEEKIIEDKEIMNLKILSKEIEKINRKEQDGLKSDKSETDERDKIEISDVLIGIDSKNKVDNDDLVDNDTDQESSEEE